MLITLGTWLACYWFGWRMTVLIPMAITFILPERNVILDFLFCFFSIFIVWTGYSYFLSSTNHHLLTDRMTSLFSMSNSITIFTITGIIGGLIAGAGGSTGYFLHHFLKNKERS